MAASRRVHIQLAFMVLVGLAFHIWHNSYDLLEETSLRGGSGSLDDETYVLDDEIDSTLSDTSPSSPSPSTLPPTALPPSTSPPTTRSPTTRSPTTQSPTTQSPSTQSPTSKPSTIKSILSPTPSTTTICTGLCLNLEPSNMNTLYGKEKSKFFERSMLLVFLLKTRGSSLTHSLD